MILSTTNSNHDDQGRAYLYAPVDTKYLHPAAQSAVDSAYTAGISSANNIDQFDGFGLEDLMSQRQELILAKGKLLLSEIYQRRKLKEENLYQISVDQCTCRNLIYLLEDNHLDKRRIDLERQIIGLEQEKRKEKGNYFRDILFLKKELRETAIEKLEEDQKTAVLRNQKEDLS